MILAISLENFLFMPRANLEFSPGLNVITGETGAGKSVLLEAVKLILGKKARAGLVLPGQSNARVQAEFDISQQLELLTMLEQSGFHNDEDPGRLSITRTFKEEGNGRVLVNGILTTAAFLKQLGPFLTEIHGQNEHQTLLEPEIQRGLLDRTGSMPHKNNLQELKIVFKERQKLQEKLIELENRHQHSAERINELQSILQELTSLNLTDTNEEETLKDDLKRLGHSEQIINGLQGAVNFLSGTDEAQGAILQTYRAAESLKRIAQFDNRIEDFFQRSNGIYFELKALEADVDNLASDTELDPERLNQIQARLADISRICRKHSTDFNGLFLLKTRINDELEELFAPDSTREKIRKDLSAIDRKFSELHGQITKERQKLAKALKEKVSEEMAHLGFNAADFTATLNLAPPGSHGAETVEFFVSLNPGSPGGPLRKIASGGELSRVALAIKKVMARSDALPTLVFDEIDAGIGGKTAEAVAESLRSLGEEKQVLLVTHLHQIAKEGNYHFMVSKSVKDQQTQVAINRVTGDERVEEIARMLGQTDSQGLAFARNLLDKTVTT